MSVLFHHLHLYCNDLETMANFWHQGFAATEVGRRIIRSMPAVDMKLPGDIHLVVQQVKNEPNIQTTGYNHIGFEVKDIEAELERLTSIQGIMLRDAPQEIGAFIVAFITGPEGVVVELLMKK